MELNIEDVFNTINGATENPKKQLYLKGVRIWKVGKMGIKGISGKLIESYWYISYRARHQPKPKKRYIQVEDIFKVYSDLKGPTTKDALTDGSEGDKKETEKFVPTFSHEKFADKGYKYKEMAEWLYSDFVKLYNMPLSNKEHVMCQHIERVLRDVSGHVASMKK